MDDLITMAIPGVITDKERQELLRKAALAFAEGEESGEAAITVLTYAHESLTGYRIQQTCLAYAKAVRAREELTSNPGAWRDHYPDLDDGGDLAQEDVAPRLAADEADEALNVLTFGSSAR
jgi:hypothetical protein